MNKLKFLVTGILFLFLSVNCFAAKRYWVAANDSIWNSTRNWSATSGGAFGASVPGSSDTAYFDSGSVKNDTFNINVSVKRIEISSGYTGTIIQGAKTLTIGTSGAVLSGGTFSGGSANITCSGTFTISGCAFTSTSGTFSLSDNYTLSSGSYTANNGKISFTSTLTISGSSTFKTLDFSTSGNSTITISGGTTLTATDVRYSGTHGEFLTGSGMINVNGDLYMNNTSGATGGTVPTISFTGTGSQHLYGSSSLSMSLPNIIINKSSDTLHLSNIISTEGDWTYTSGVVDAGTSTVTLIQGSTITGSHSLYNVTLYANVNSSYIIASGTTLTVTGTLLATGSHIISVAGNISAKGDVTNSNTNISGGGTGTITFNGTGSQTFTGSGTIGKGPLPNIVINKSSGTLSLANNITVKGDWTWTAGAISPGSSTINFSGTKTITGTHTLGNVTFDGSSAATYTIASGNTLTASGTLTVNGTAAVTLNTGNIYSTGDISITNTATTAAGTASIVINGTGDQTLTGSGTAGQGRLPKITIDKTSGVLTLASIISVANNWTYMQGTVDASTNTSTVAFYGALNLDGQGTSTTMSFYNVTTGGSTITLTGNLNVSNNLTINSSTTLSAGSNSITVGGNWNDNGTWTYSTSTVTFNGNGFKTISKASGTETFYNLGLNHTTAKTTHSLSNPVNVNNTLTLTKGRFKSTSTNILELIDNATLSGGGDSAYVQGPVRKTGNDPFTFPIGDTTVHSTGAYHPLFMTAPSSTSDQFEASYFPVAQSYGSALSTGDTAVSSCEYWTFKRTTGTSTPTVSLTWNSNCDNSGFTEMTELLWNGSAWLDLGQASVTVANSKSGKLTASSATSFTVNPAPITIGYKTVKKSFSVLAKTPDGGYFNVDGNELYFAFTEEYQDSDGLLSYSIRDLSTGQDVTLLANSNNSPAVSYGNNQYRIDLYNASNVALSSGYYMLEVTNEKNEKWYLRFKI